MECNFPKQLLTYWLTTGLRVIKYLSYVYEWIFLHENVRVHACGTPHHYHYYYYYYYDYYYYYYHHHYCYYHHHCYYLRVKQKSPIMRKHKMVHCPSIFWIRFQFVYTVYEHWIEHQTDWISSFFVYFLPSPVSCSSLFSLPTLPPASLSLSF